MQNQTFNGGEIETWRGQAMQLEPALRNSHADKFDYIVTSAGTDDYLLSFEDKEVIVEMTEPEHVHITECNIEKDKSVKYDHIKYHIKYNNSDISSKKKRMGLFAY